MFQKWKWLRFENGDLVPTVSIIGEKIDPKKFFELTVEWHKRKGPTYQVVPSKLLNRLRCGSLTNQC
jgi:hypothetical protein